jgi:hypothetical protein
MDGEEREFRNSAGRVFVWFGTLVTAFAGVAGLAATVAPEASAAPGDRQQESLRRASVGEPNGDGGERGSH